MMVFVLNIERINTRFGILKKHHLKFCQWITWILVALIILTSALVHDVNFNGFLFYAVLPCVSIVTWFQFVAACYKRSEAQLGLFSAPEAWEMNENYKEMVQDCVFVYRDNFCIIPRIIMNVI